MTKEEIYLRIDAWIGAHSRAALAGLLGITPPTLADRLSGRSKWKWEEICRLAEILNCSTDDLRALND